VKRDIDAGDIPTIITVALGLVAFFVVLPGKIIYKNTDKLKPFARLTFALTSPAIVYFFMFFGFYHISRLLDAWLKTYAAYAGMLIALLFGSLAVFLWYRCLGFISGGSGQSR
jgi:hypothetical protein